MACGEAGEGDSIFVFFMKNLNFCPRLAALPAAVFVLCAAPTHAQTLPEVVVTPSRSAQPLTDALPHTTVLNATDIERSQATDLPYLLQKEAGFQFTQNGGRGTSSSLFLRGAASLQVLVLIDGVPLTKQDASGAVSLEHLMLDQVERVEIVRGNVSAIYGTGAVGGVVQIFTKAGGGAPRADVTLEAGSRRSSKISTGVQAGFGADGATKLSAGASVNRTRGFSALDTSVPTNAFANPDNDGYRNRNWSLALSHDIVKGHTLGLRTTHSDGRSDFDSPFDAPTDIHKSRTRVDATTLFSQNRLTSNWLSKINVSQSRDRNTNDYQTAFPFQSAYTTKNRLLNWTNTFAFGKEWSATAGLEQQRQSVKVDDGFGGLYDKDRRVNALFAGVQGQVNNFSVQLNARRDTAQGLDAQTTGYLGAGYAFTPHWKVIGSTSSAFNIPPLGYLYAPFFGNTSLQPEKTKSTEAGVQYSQGSHVLRATWFRTRSRNQFEYDFTSFQFQNIARSKNTGLELSYSGQVGSADVRASLTTQKPVDETTGQTLNRRTKQLASLSVSQPVGAWRLGADMRYSGARRDGTENLKAYTLFDISARYQVAKEFTMFGRVENLSNVKYQTAYGYNQAPRGVFVGLNWQPTF
jgi:vitamin B12 transporter